MSIKNLAIALIATVGFSVTAQADHHKGDGMKDGPTITDIVVNSDQHTTLETAVVEAGLADTLAGKGPFTVFAPTDAAFAALPEGTLKTLLMPENQDKLQGILTYHVVEGKVSADKLLGLIETGETMYEVTTMNGEIVARTEGGAVTLEDAQGNRVTVTMTDIEASNGVVHVIDGVLLP
ncbi:Uncaracterized surface protein containing fasciclin (FAS1) repeats [Marinobacter daqiaonensis]|uniref:Uncaracterized surface protein containing fasciclin (FAS1) repeats n=1 Tax=Marinobacter daqiaonensis TaxID=650891 RepID=A0A1I6IC48_9GAMM|nr:fasciclin domain-containing protein [Marinobacter daqiaonensis]SFR64327.1 Uncaracterized surface protein containing fasciclin (FAS1) repeats [Marinobacter daqiaonensis]